MERDILKDIKEINAI